MSDDKYLRAARRLVAHVGSVLEADFGVELWNGEVLALGPGGRTDLRLKIMDPDVLTRLLRRPGLGRVLDIMAEGGLRLEGGTLLDLADRRGSMKTKGLLRRLGKLTLARSLWPFLVRRSARREGQHDYRGAVAESVEAGATTSRWCNSTTICRMRSMRSSSARDGLYLCLFGRPGNDSRYGAARQARDDLPQAAARSRASAFSISAAAGAGSSATRRSITASRRTA